MVLLLEVRVSSSCVFSMFLMVSEATVECFPEMSVIARSRLSVLKVSVTSVSSLCAYVPKNMLHCIEHSQGVS